MHTVRNSDAVYGAEAGIPSGRADAWAPGPDVVVRLRAAEGKLRSLYGKWSKKHHLYSVSINISNISGDTDYVMFWSC